MKVVDVLEMLAGLEPEDEIICNLWTKEQIQDIATNNDITLTEEELLEVIEDYQEDYSACDDHQLILASINGQVTRRLGS